jgi:hypothetical protein
LECSGAARAGVIDVFGVWRFNFWSQRDSWQMPVLRFGVEAPLELRSDVALRVAKAI